MARFLDRIDAVATDFEHNWSDILPWLPTEQPSRQTVLRIAFHEVSSHQTRNLECFADSSSIPWNPPTIFRPDLNATVSRVSLP